MFESTSGAEMTQGPSHGISTSYAGRPKLVYPPQRANYDEPASDWTVEILSIRRDGFPVSPEIKSLAEKAVAAETALFADAWDDKADRLDHDAMDMRREADLIAKIWGI